MTVTGPAPTIERDGYGRPLIVPPGGGKPKAYTRATTFAGTMEDTYNLGLWQQRMTAVGLSERADLLLAVSAHRDDKKRLDEIVEQAKEAAQAHAAATTGTALHALAEQLDRGQVVPTVPEAYLDDLAAYARTTQGMTHLHIERLLVLDDLKVAGTPDRVVEYKGGRYIADIKTGSITYGMGKIAVQLALYSRGHLYDPETGQREPLGVDQRNALVIHLPAGTGTCSLHWVNIAAGWEAVQHAAWVRSWRSRRDLSVPV